MPKSVLLFAFKESIGNEINDYCLPYKETETFDAISFMYTNYSRNC